MGRGRQAPGAGELPEGVVSFVMQMAQEAEERHGRKDNQEKKPSAGCRQKLFLNRMFFKALLGALAVLAK